jgi:osmotically-inducible protein OsmY
VQAARIAVDVKRGVVTLSGHVDSYAQKWSAERAAQRVAGAMVMVSALKVQISGDAARADLDIARSVENVLEWSSSLPTGTVRVMVEAGWVTLSGEVDWQFQRRVAIDSVRQLMGVTGVSDQIVIRPAPGALPVQADIEAALQRSARAGSAPIAVRVQGADVTLSGSVRNWGERENATNAAWGTPGVRKVVDQLQLVD